MSDRGAFGEVEIGFRLDLFRLTENASLVLLATRVLADYFRALAAQLPGDLTERSRVRGRQKHLPLVEALRKGDLEAARAAFWRHGVDAVPTRESAESIVGTGVAP